jgi:hypothetical protein
VSPVPERKFIPEDRLPLADPFYSFGRPLWFAWKRRPISTAAWVQDVVATPQLEDTREQIGITMAFNNVGHYWLRNGNSMWVNVTMGRLGEDRGAQWIMADPKPFDTFPTPSGITQLETGRFQKRVTYTNGGTLWQYFALVENTASPGWNHTWFSLSGGGNT